VITRWLRRSMWLAAFGCLWLPVCDDPPLHSDAYLVDVTTDGAAIGLITRAPLRVQATVRDAAGAVVARIDEDAPRRRHSFVVSGLQPAAIFDYELTGEGGASWRGHIRTAPREDRAPVKFVFLGDSGDQPWWVWMQTSPALYWPARWGWFGGASAVTQVGAAVAGYHPDFVLHLGDVVYPKGRNGHYWSGFFLPFEAALRDAPFYAVLGNHDLMDTGGLQCLANLRADSPAYRGDGRNFTFARGPVRVIALDFNSEFTGERVEPGHPALTYLLAQLAKCEEPWIVVASHFPIRSQSRQGNRADLLLSLLPELSAYGVSLYMSGHDHCYQRFGEPGGDQPVLVVSGGGGKELYEVHPVQRGPHAVALAKAWHWCSAETAGDRLRVQAHGLDGLLIDQFELRLPAGELLERIRARSAARASRIERLRG
jgi:hypothetical protein